MILQTNYWQTTSDKFKTFKSTRKAYKPNLNVTELQKRPNNKTTFSALGTEVQAAKIQELITALNKEITARNNAFKNNTSYTLLTNVGSVAKSQLVSKSTITNIISRINTMVNDTLNINLNHNILKTFTKNSNLYYVCFQKPHTYTDRTEEYQEIETYIDTEEYQEIETYIDTEEYQEQEEIPNDFKNALKKINLDSNSIVYLDDSLVNYYPVIEGLTQDEIKEIWRNINDNSEISNFLKSIGIQLKRYSSVDKYTDYNFDNSRDPLYVGSEIYAWSKNSVSNIYIIDNNFNPDDFENSNNLILVITKSTSDIYTQTGLTPDGVISKINELTNKLPDTITKTVTKTRQVEKQRTVTKTREVEKQRTVTKTRTVTDVSPGDFYMVYRPSKSISLTSGVFKIEFLSNSEITTKDNTVEVRDFTGTWTGEEYNPKYPTPSWNKSQIENSVGKEVGTRNITLTQFKNGVDLKTLKIGFCQFKENAVSNITWLNDLQITALSDSNVQFKSISTSLAIDSDNLIKSSLINKLKDQINRAEMACLCDCNYCSCDCNYCSCDCNYCSCDCNYCSCDCNYCSCDCNYCSCDCNYYGRITCQDTIKSTRSGALLNKNS